MKKIIVIVFVFFTSNCENFKGSVSLITPEIFMLMGYSWKDNNPVPLDDLRYLSVSHYGFDGSVHQGELIVHNLVAEEVVEIFKEIFDAQYPIEKMKFVDAYQGIDELSAQDNNSYAFCSRPITGQIGRFSKHSYGLAVDINPLYNPYHKGDLIIPQNGAEYLDRTIITPATLCEDNPCCQAFIKRGWAWGGSWGPRGLFDYHHFEKDPADIIKSYTKH